MSAFFVRTVTAVAVASALASCGSGSGTSLNSPLTESQIGALLPTPSGSMPTSGTATYAGNVVVTSFRAPDGTTPDTLNGALSMTADFAKAAMSATASNFTDASSLYKIAGTVSGSGAITGNTVSIPATGSITATDIATNVSKTNPVSTTFNGTFKGASAQAIAGTIIETATNTQSGTFYASK